MLGIPQLLKWRTDGSDLIAKPTDIPASPSRRSEFANLYSRAGAIFREHLRRAHPNRDWRFVEKRLRRQFVPVDLHDALR